MMLELLRADVAPEAEKASSGLAYWCDQLGVTSSRFAPREQPVTDTSHPGIAVNLTACIQCNRCVRACREEQVNDVIGYAHRGEASKIVFDLDVAMGRSTCVGCCECVQACPTGALVPATVAAAVTPAASATAIEAPRFIPTRKVDSLCPFCGVGCQLTYHVAGEGAAQKIVFAQGRDGPANAGRLFESLWGTTLPTEPGLTVVEIMDAASAGRIRGMHIEDENPAMSDPDLEHARAALVGLEHLVVQDIFLTETAMLADVVCCPHPACTNKPAASPTPTAWCSCRNRCCRCTARRARTGGSSRRSRSAWASTGTTLARPRSSPNSPAPCASVSKGSESFDRQRGRSYLP